MLSGANDVFAHSGPPSFAKADGRQMRGPQPKPTIENMMRAPRTRYVSVGWTARMPQKIEAGWKMPKRA